MKRVPVDRPARDRVASRYIVVTCALGLAVGSCGRGGEAVDSARATSAEHLPAGYALRLDRANRDPVDFVAATTPDGLSVRTGPAGIIYRPEQVAETDSYTVRARFTEIEAPVGHREGFGLFIGGQDLDGASQRYVYFLVRGDGRYLIKRRDGGSTQEISSGWESSEAVRIPAAGGGDVINDLAITVDGGRLRFSCNDAQVADVPIGDLRTAGVVGVRVNHNLAVRVDDLHVEP